MPIPEELLETLSNKGELDTDTISKQVSQYSNEDWIDAIDDELLDKQAKLNLIELIKADSAKQPIVIRLSNQSSFGILVAREIMSDTRDKELSEIIERSCLSRATNSRSKEKAIAALIVDKETIFWFFRILFSKNFLRGAKSIFYDYEADVRMRSIEALASFEGEEVLVALVNALDDTDSKVRGLAENLIRARLPEEEANEIFKREEESISGLRQSALNAKESVWAIISKIPGFATLSSVLDTTFDTLTDAKNVVVNKVSGGISGIASRFKRTPSNGES